MSTNSNNYLAVNEIFGPTIQGEGPSIGKPCVFVRLAGCNLACTWCDSQYSWNWKEYDPKIELQKMTIDAVYRQMMYFGMGIKSVVITGGEPLLQQRALVNLLRKLKANGWYIEIETAGTRQPFSQELVDLVDTFNVSLKLINSGNPFLARTKPKAIESLRDTGKAIWKFVASTEMDFIEIDELVIDFQLPKHNVFIMPEGTTPEAITDRLNFIIPKAIDRDYNVTTRLQVMVYGNKRKV